MKIENGKVVLGDSLSKAKTILNKNKELVNSFQSATIAGNKAINVEPMNEKARKRLVAEFIGSGYLVIKNGKFLMVVDE